MVSSSLEFVIFCFFSLTVWRKELNHTGMVVALEALSVVSFKWHTLPFSDYFAILGHFEITPSGYILVKKALDAEEESSFNLTIEARDEGQPRRSNTVSTLQNMATNIRYKNN